jgi:hypothetical protein
VVTEYQYEQWREIRDFPPYAISNHGRVKNLDTDIIKIASVNQQGIPNVLFMKNGLQYRRAVPLLVANYFLDAPIRDTFDTPINLDGKRTNNVVENLAWRPRWFAIEYHKQFKEPLTVSGRVQLSETGEVFNDIRQCAKRFGLLEREVVDSIHNRVPVFPTWQMFQFAQ